MTAAMRAGIIGWPLRHSLSPALFAEAFAQRGIAGRYDAHPVPPGDVGSAVAALRAEAWRGFNVTIPHKETVLAHLDAVEPAARTIGAVNCVVNDGGRFIGHNTDAAAFLAGLVSVAGFDAAGKRVVVIGAGGAAHAVVHALAGRGLDALTILARRPKQADDLLEDLAVGGTGLRSEALPLEPAAQPAVRNVLAVADLVVNTTPVGMSGTGTEGQLPIDLSQGLAPGVLVYDLIYRPRETALLRDARARGARTLDGLPMLAFQAAAAFELWTGVPMTGDEMLAIAERASSRTPGRVEESARG